MQTCSELLHHHLVGETIDDCVGIFSGRYFHLQSLFIKWHEEVRDLKDRDTYTGVRFTFKHNQL